jgi:hypothetical protein
LAPTIAVGQAFSAAARCGGVAAIGASKRLSFGDEADFGVIQTSVIA